MNLLFTFPHATLELWSLFITARIGTGESIESIKRTGRRIAVALGLHMPELHYRPATAI